MSDFKFGAAFPKINIQPTQIRISDFFQLVQLTSIKPDATAAAAFVNGHFAEAVMMHGMVTIRAIHILVLGYNCRKYLEYMGFLPYFSILGGMFIIWVKAARTAGLMEIRDMQEQVTYE